MMPEYVNAYLNSFYGKQYLLYLSRQTEQVNLNCKEVEIVLIPEMSEKFQEKLQFYQKVQMNSWRRHGRHMASAKNY